MRSTPLFDEKGMPSCSPLFFFSRTSIIAAREALTSRKRQPPPLCDKTNPSVPTGDDSVSRKNVQLDPRSTLLHAPLDSIDFARKQHNKWPGRTLVNPRYNWHYTTQNSASRPKIHAATSQRHPVNIPKTFCEHPRDTP